MVSPNSIQCLNFSFWNFTNGFCQMNQLSLSCTCKLAYLVAVTLAMRLDKITNSGPARSWEVYCNCIMCNNYCLLYYYWMGTLEILLTVWCGRGFFTGLSAHCIKSNNICIICFQDQYIFCYKACLQVLQSLNAN